MTISSFPGHWGLLTFRIMIRCPTPGDVYYKQNYLISSLYTERPVEIIYFGNSTEGFESLPCFSLAMWPWKIDVPSTNISSSLVNLSYLLTGLLYGYWLDNVCEALKWVNTEYLLTRSSVNGSKHCNCQIIIVFTTFRHLTSLLCVS